jgi:hypothetical protein
VVAAQVHYFSTSSERLNPNLYHDGKVCLSLLGTWSGPGWVPGQSTLLQVDEGLLLLLLLLLFDFFGFEQSLQMCAEVLACAPRQAGCWRGICSRI